MKIGFDNDLYVKVQSENIKKTFKLFDKLYLEIGGKLFEDNHAARVLPGFKPDAKISMFQELKKDLEIIFCISAEVIEKRKTRADYGITYDVEVLRLIEKAKNQGFDVNSVVITLYKPHKSVDDFIKRLERENIKTYIHYYTKGYPTDIDTIVSEEGYGANEFIKTTKPLVLVSAPGPASGKLATCLSQLYHEHKLGVNAGYAKFETFPVWDLPLKHPINMAYEAATADIKDVNMIDPYHLEKYGESSVNYNRDIETFPILKAILNKITGKDVYYSPTDMGVNMISKAIIDEEVCIHSAKKEIVRRYYNEMCNYKMGTSDEEAPLKVKMLMNELEIDETILETIKPALEKAQKEHRHVAAIQLQLPDGRVVTGKETDLLSPASSAVLNAIKEITNIPDEIMLLSESVLKPILELKNNGVIDNNSKTLKLREVLIALSICAITNPVIDKALKNIQQLSGCDAHATYIISNDDLKVLKNLKINLTCEPVFYTEDKFEDYV